MQVVADRSGKKNQTVFTIDNFLESPETKNVESDESKDKVESQCDEDLSSETFSSTAKSDKHVRVKHKLYKDRAQNNRKEKCKFCEKDVVIKHMKQHVKACHTHQEEKNFSCETCGKCFKYKSTLSLHIPSHTGEMKYFCSTCGKKFRRAADATHCEKAHKGIFSFECSKCDYKTQKKDHFDRHLNSHSKSTPFLCPLCGFRSGRKDNLKQHVEKRHCTSSTNLKQLEKLHPDMYTVHPDNIINTNFSVDYLNEGAPNNLNVNVI